MGTYIWCGAPGADFGNPANWIPNGLPGAQDNICLFSGADVVTFRGPPAVVDNISILSAGPTGLSVDGFLTALGQITFQDTSLHLTINGALTVSGRATFTSIQLGGQNQASNLDVSDGGALLVDRGVVWADSLDIAHDAKLQITSGSLFINGAASVQQYASAAPILIRGSGSTFSILDTGKTTGDLSLWGRITVDQGASASADNVSIASPLYADPAEVANITVGDTADSGANAQSTLRAVNIAVGSNWGFGNLTAARNGNISIGHSLTIFAGASVSVDGGSTIEVGGFGNAQLGTLQIDSGGSLEGAGVVTAPISMNGGKIEASGGLLKIDGTLSNYGTVLVDDGAQLEITGNVSGSLILQRGGILVLDSAGDATSTVEIVPGAGTLLQSGASVILNDLAEFKGSLSGLELDDQIVINNAKIGAPTGQSVVSASIAVTNGHEVLRLGIGLDSSHVSSTRDISLAGETDFSNVVLTTSVGQQYTTVSVNDKSHLYIAAGGTVTAPDGFTDTATFLGNSGKLIVDVAAGDSPLVNNLQAGDQIEFKGLEKADGFDQPLMAVTIGQFAGDSAQSVQLQFGTNPRTPLRDLDLKLDEKSDNNLSGDYFSPSKAADGSLILTLVAGNPIDDAVHGPAARTFGVDGSGIKVGVISANSPSTGEFEGNPMGQIVQAIAPGAQLDLQDITGKGGQGLVDAIAKLAADGCQIIVDDTALNHYVLGGKVHDDDASANNLINKLVKDKGISFVTSAGNQEAYTNIVGEHKLNPNVITVAAMNWLGTDIQFLPAATEPFSSIGPAGSRKPSITAPDGGPVDSSLSDTGHSFSPAFGTSYAAPAVAGVLALMMQANPQLESNASWAQAVLESSANHFGLPQKEGWGLVEADKAVVAMWQASQPFYTGAVSSGHSTATAADAGAKLTSALLSQDGGTVLVGSQIKIYLQTSESVSVTGIPTLLLNDGGAATYEPTGSSSKSLVFVYTLGQETTANLAVIGATGAEGIKDLQGVVDLSAIFGRPTGVSVNSPLTVTMVTTSEHGEVTAGDLVHVTVAMNEKLTLDTTGGAPSLLLNTGEAATYDAAQSDVANGKLVFDYVVQPGDTVPDLSIVQVTVPHGSSIRDAAGYNAGFHEAIGINTGLQVGPTFVDAVAASQPGVVHAGDAVQISMQLSSGVSVNGSPTLQLSDGSAAMFDTAASNAADGVLIFDWHGSSSGAPANLTVAGVETHGGSIVDQHGVNADFSLAAGLGTGLTVNSPLWVQSVASSGSLTVGHTSLLVLSMSEPAALSPFSPSTPDLVLSTGAVAKFDSIASDPANGKLAFDYLVRAGDDLSNLKVMKVDVNGSLIADGQSFQADFSGTAGMKVLDPKDTIGAAGELFQFMSGHVPEKASVDNAVSVITKIAASLTTAAGWDSFGASLADSAFADRFVTSFEGANLDTFISAVTQEVFGNATNTPALHNEYTILRDYYAATPESSDPTGDVRAKGAFIADILHEASDIATGIYYQAGQSFVAAVGDGTASYGVSWFN